MGDEKFQQIKQVRSSPPPLSVLPALPKLCMTARFWRRCCRRHAALSRFIFARDICAPVVRRQRAADPSQQDVPVDEATAGARAVRAAQRPAAPRFFLCFFYVTPSPQVWNGLLQKLWEQSANPSDYSKPEDVDVDLKVRSPLKSKRGMCSAS